MRIITLNATASAPRRAKACSSGCGGRARTSSACRRRRRRSTSSPTHDIGSKGYHELLPRCRAQGYCGVAIYTTREPDARRARLRRRRSSTARAATSRRSSASCPSSRCTCLRLGRAPSGRPRSTAFSTRSCRISTRLRRRRRDYIICGDWNIAHQKIDLRNWRSNQKNSGFLPEERAWLDRLFGHAGYVDAFREVNAKPEQYTWWSNRGQAARRTSAGASITRSSSRSLAGSARAAYDLQGQVVLRSRAADHGLRHLSRRRATPRVRRREPRGWLQALLVYRQPRVLSMLFLGLLRRACRSIWCSRRCRPGCARRASSARPSACCWVGLVVLDQVPVGADRRSHAAAASHALARPPAQLDAARAGGHRHRPAQLSSSDPSAGVLHDRGVGAVRSRSARRRRTSRSTRGASSPRPSNAGRDGGGVPDRLSRRADHGERRRVRDRARSSAGT